MIRIAAALLLGSSCAVAAAECQSVGGHIEGERKSVVRTVRLKGSEMILSGRMDGKAMPTRSLSCVALASGVFCGGTFGPVDIAIMTNGKRMTENVTLRSTGQETAGFAYVCDRSFRLR